MKTNTNLLLMLMTASLFMLSSVVSAHSSDMRSDCDSTLTLSITKARESLKDDCFLYFDVNHIADSISRNGEKTPYFLDWIFKNVKELNGTYGLLENHVRTMIPEVDDSFDTEGPSFKHRPVIWIVDDKFVALTGTKSHSVRYKAHTAYEKDLAMMLNKVCKVYVSRKNDVWKPWFEYDNLSDIRPVTIFIYTNMPCVLDVLPNVEE